MPVFECEQLLPAPLDEVFAFHADPYNLLKITPPALDMVVKNPERVEMRKGAEIVYTIKLMGLPVGWRTLITEYDPPRSFQDVQLKGPYKKWHHTHTFEARGDQTLVKDRVDYELPMGLAGRLAAGWLVRRQLEGIFKYREQALAQAFAPK